MKLKISKDAVEEHERMNEIFKYCKSGTFYSAALYWWLYSFFPFFFTSKRMHNIQVKKRKKDQQLEADKDDALTVSKNLNYTPQQQQQLQKYVNKWIRAK